MPLSVDIFNKKILSSQSRFGKYDILLSGEAGGSEFTVRPTVNGTGVLLSGEAYPLSNPSGFITGVDLSNYATLNNLELTGQNLQNQIDNLDSIYATDVSLSQTGQFLDQKIDTFSGTYQNFVNNLDTNYASQSEFDTLSGNLNSTGQNLNNKINSLSGAAVLTYGDQYIDGQKIFRGEVRIKDLYVTGTQTIVNTTNTNVGSNYILLNATCGAVDAGIFIVTGSGLTGISDTGAIIGYDVPANRWVFGNASRYSDLSQLDKIAGITDIANYSVFVNSNFYPSNNPSGFITGVDLTSYVTKINGEFANRPTVNGTGVLLSGEEQNIFKAGYIIYDSGNVLIEQNTLHENLNGKKGNFNLKNATIPNLTSGDFIFYTIAPDSNLLKAYSKPPILPAKPYFVVKNTDGRLDSYQPPEGGSADPISSTNFINLNTDGPHSGLALQHVRFHPIIQNAYKKYYLTFGQDTTVPMSNRYLESFIEIVWPSG